MVEQIGNGAAAYMSAAATGTQAKADVAEARPEVAEARMEARGEIPPSKRAVEVQISAEAKEMAADPRQEKPLDV
tara:strand:+ start:868 stop:1092 length:225 start_codon:yes stop_codon:yes gene_type:complete